MADLTMDLQSFIRLLVQRRDERRVLDLFNVLFETARGVVEGAAEGEATPGSGAGLTHAEMQLRKINNVLNNRFGPSVALPVDGIELRSVGGGTVDQMVLGVLNIYQSRFDEAASDEEWEGFGWSIVDYGIDCALMAAAHARGVDLTEASMLRLRQILSREYGECLDHGGVDVHDVVDRYQAEVGIDDPVRVFRIGRRVRWTVSDTLTSTDAGVVGISEGDDQEQVKLTLRDGNGDEFFVSSHQVRLFVDEEDD